jgi:hypothetical protein
MNSIFETSTLPASKSALSNFAGSISETRADLFVDRDHVMTEDNFQQTAVEEKQTNWGDFPLGMKSPLRWGGPGSRSSNRHLPIMSQGLYDKAKFIFANNCLF